MGEPPGQSRPSLESFMTNLVRFSSRQNRQTDDERTQKNENRGWDETERLQSETVGADHNLVSLE